ncbi:MAG TPA: sigma 54-interacting transcriptional regulator [Vicinamibacterales bacterium]|nr:sigma 54-interacting transcriptional regulator [Vicinamibacterales bacterium]HPK72421.1 sigma 54-interacting transcriptional regulator [Vicinamibacterales bacterium]
MALVQSPLRAGLLRYLGARPYETYDVEALMQTFGRIRVDVVNCLRELVSAGVVRAVSAHPALYQFARPSDPDFARLVEDFLADRPGESAEDRSPAIQRFREMIGRDEKMMVIFESIRTVAKTDLSVLILGPTGSGKEVVARIIHELSSRQHQTFQAVNCAALPDSLFESEVFGYERGAFTGAFERKPGRIELANHGTLFLDEVGDLSPMAQAKLLRVTEEHRVERLGGRTSIEVDFRLICATNRPLEALVGDGTFREDLYYRLNAFAIRLPALRERPADIPVLADRFLARFCASQGLPLDARRLAPDALQLLVAYPWPGNIRELETTVSRAALSARDGLVRARDLQFLHPVSAAARPDAPLLVPLRDVERDHIRRVLDALQWNKKRAAQVLQISRETLYRKIADFALAQEKRT